MRQTFLVTATLAAVCTPLAARQIDGEWTGAIQIQGVELGIIVRFATGDSLAGTIDIPQQGAADVPLEQVRHAHPAVHFELTTPIGPAVFDGTMEGDSISGSFTQGPANATFYLTRGGEPAAPDPDADLPYRAEEVEFHSGDLRLAGTLTVPDGPGPHPAVVMITGSGPQNRDEELFGFKPFRIIADHLTRHGVAVLRYDDRGVGGSDGSVSESTTADFADDVLAAIAFLGEDARIDARHIGLVGHSEGGLVAPLAASRSSAVAFVVLLAGPALTGEEIILAQGELILRANGGDESRIETFRRNQRMVYRALRTDEGWDEVETVLEGQVREGLDSLSGAGSDPTQRERLVRTQVEAQLTQVRSPWFRYFLTYDPRPALRATRVPVLALFGELDLQVPADRNLDQMERAFRDSGNDDVTLRILPRANHLFIPATTGSPSEYATLEKVFVPELLDLMTDWITRHAGLTPPSP